MGYFFIYVADVDGNKFYLQGTGKSGRYSLGKANTLQDAAGWVSRSIADHVAQLMGDEYIVEENFGAESLKFRDAQTYRAKKRERGLFRQAELKREKQVKLADKENLDALSPVERRKILRARLKKKITGLHE